MGDPKFPRRAYDTPSHPWRGERIKAETEICKQYGLKSKTELWKAQAYLRNLRTQSKNLQARVRLDDAQAQLESDLLLAKCARLGILPADGSTLDDVLGLDQESILGRRLQTIVYMKGLATTAKQARQFIVHGHISINGRKVTVPGYMVRRNEEDFITYNPQSPIADEMHPIRNPQQSENEAAPEPKVEEPQPAEGANEPVDAPSVDAINKPVEE